MALFDAGSAINIKKLEFGRLFDGVNARVSKTKLSVDYKDTKERESFTGSFSANAFAQRINGTATGWKVVNYKTGHLVFRFTDIELSAAAVLAAAKTKTKSDDHAIVEKMLAGKDTFFGSSADDVLYGYDGDDIFFSGKGGDRIDGGAGERDHANYENSAKAVEVALARSDWSSVKLDGIGEDRIRNIEDVSGGKANDLLVGDKNANRLNGNGGDDSLSGGKGDDTLQGGDGNDTVHGGKGDDDLRGGKGNDLLDGARDDDLIKAGSGNDTLKGAKGDDTLMGGPGDDLLEGGKNSDSLKGGSGEDTLVGGAGQDVLNGGRDADTFRFVAVTDTANKDPDLIGDFKHRLDVIDLSAIDAITSTADGADDAFIRDARGNENTPVAEGHIGWYKVNRPGTANDRTYILINNDIDAAIDMTIELKGALKLGAADFIL
jgi:Ca2+-binding RTX toxin-like protein